tara:strand:- start:115 stop:405 length:291 start_codon:yes stop_codon:yes gene_type:complete
MKNLLLVFSIIFLILSTAMIKNSSKKLESKIFDVRENLSILDEKYDYIFLENNYLSSPQKLNEYKNSMFTDEYVSLNILNIKILKEDNKLNGINND